MEEITDTELVAAARTGDRDAFGVLVDRHYARTRALARAVVGDDAEDVVQEAVLQAFLGLEHLREPERFGAWLYGIAANLARMRLRRVALQQSAARSLPAVQPDGAERAETTALVRDALAVLPAAQREAVLMHDLAGYTAGEIAERVGGSSAAVRVRLHRGRRELRSRLAALRPTTKTEVSMVEVELRDVIVRVDGGGGDDGTPRLVNENRILLLQERGGVRVLPIWVGAPEGDALALHLGSEPVPRPLTADLMARLLEASGARVERVVVSSLRENTFYGIVRVISSAGDAVDVDSRPSDAINLAVRVGAPILVERSMFDDSAMASGAREHLDREMRKVAERLGHEAPEPLPGEWRSLSPDLVRTLGSWPKSPAPPAEGGEDA